MASVVSAARGRVDATPLSATAAVGDLVCIAMFVALGGVQHGTIDQFGRMGLTYVSFAGGWALTSLLVGVYAVDARSVRRTLRRVVPAWVGAAVVAQGLRSTATFPGRAQLSFFVVSVLVGAALLAGWRFLVARVEPGV